MASCWIWMLFSRLGLRLRADGHDGGVRLTARGLSGRQRRVSVRALIAGGQFRPGRGQGADTGDYITDGIDGHGIPLPLTSEKNPLVNADIGTPEGGS